MRKIYDKLSIFHKMLIAPSIGILLFALFLSYTYKEQKLSKLSFNSVESSLFPRREIAKENLNLLDTINNELESAVSAGERSWIANTKVSKDKVGENLKKLKVLMLEVGKAEEVDTLEKIFDSYYQNAVDLSYMMLSEDEDLTNDMDLDLLIDTMKKNKKRVKNGFESLHNNLKTELAENLKEGQVHLDRILLIGTILGLMFIIVMIGVTMMVALPTRRGLKEVQSSMNNILTQRPDFSKRISYNSYDEVGRLVNSFNHFTHNLESIYKELETNASRVESSLDEFKYLFHSTIEGIVITQDNICIDINEQGLRMFGSDDRSDVIGKHMMQFIDPSSHAVVAQHAAIESTEPYEVKLFRNDGTLFPALVQGHNLPSIDGMKRISAVLDLSDIKEKEKLLEEQKNLALEAEKKAQEASKAKSYFLANMSHEIRTPMNGILGMTYLTLQTELSQKQKNYVEKIKIASDTLLAIINDLLDVSKIEAGKLELEYIVFDLHNVIENVVNLMEPKIEEKGLNLEVIFHEPIKTFVYGDSLRVTQILSNLVSNAVKFTREGKIRIDISQLNSDRYKFEISDTGIGMNKGEIEKLFTPFSQADESTTRKFGGTGLGLSISKQLIELMNGTIDVSSKPEEGSLFSIQIDLKEQNKNELLIENEEEVESQGNISKEEHQVLLVEDNEMNREIILEILHGFGLEVDTAINGEEAINHFKSNSNKYNMIFMDIQMPLMDGYEATKNLRLIDKDIPIVALTANAMKEDIEKTKSVGMNEHLNKPLDIEKLKKILIKYLGSINSNFSKHEKQLQDIPGIDIKKGLYHVNNSLETYKKTIRHFIDKYEDIESSIESITQDELNVILHTQKGLSGTIGASSLQEIIENLELSDTAENRAEYIKENRKIIKALKHSDLYTLSTSQDDPKGVLDPKKMKVLLEELRSALLSQQPALINPVVEKLSLYTYDSSIQKQLHTCLTLIKQYRYKDALKLLEDL